MSWLTTKSSTPLNSRLEKSGIKEHNRLVGRIPGIVVFEFIKSVFRSPQRIKTDARVEIYTWRACPYCIRAKRLLQKLGIEFIEHRIDGDESARTTMSRLARGLRTVPQIFINGQHLGGCDDLVRHYKSTRLPLLLNTDEVDLKHLAYEGSRTYLEAVEVLHQNGFQSLRICPILAPSGTCWRLNLAPKNLIDDTGCRLKDGALKSNQILNYSSASPLDYFDKQQLLPLDGASIAYELQRKKPDFLAVCKGADPEYATWYRSFLKETEGVLPYADSDKQQPQHQWEFYWDGFPEFPERKYEFERKFPGL